MKNSILSKFLGVVLLLSHYELVAQFQFSSLRLPDASPKSWIGHRVGITDITVEYGSPQVKDRGIWGKLVLYDRVWRAGANENTIITFSDSVTINGSLLPPGRYGLHILRVKEGEWTVIFSTNSTSWAASRTTRKKTLFVLKQSLLRTYSTIGCSTSLQTLLINRLHYRQFGRSLEYRFPLKQM